MFDNARQLYRDRVPRWFRRRVFSYLRGEPLAFSSILPAKISFRELTFIVKLVRCVRSGRIEVLFYGCEAFPDRQDPGSVEVLLPPDEDYEERKKYL